MVDAGWWMLGGGFTSDLSRIDPLEQISSDHCYLPELTSLMPISLIDDFRLRDSMIADVVNVPHNILDLHRANHCLTFNKNNTRSMRDFRVSYNHAIDNSSSHLLDYCCCSCCCAAAAAVCVVNACEVNFILDRKSVDTHHSLP